MNNNHSDVVNTNEMMGIIRGVLMLVVSTCVRYLCVVGEGTEESWSPWLTRTPFSKVLHFPILSIYMALTVWFGYAILLYFNGLRPLIYLQKSAILRFFINYYILFLQYPLIHYFSLLYKIYYIVFTLFPTFLKKYFKY